MGAETVNDRLPELLDTVNEAGHPVVWAGDPIHANTFTAPHGRKTRHFEDILTEIKGFFEAHSAVGTIPGGVHIELTGDRVTECLGGAEEILDTDLSERYETMCDPRLNGRQSVDLAFRVSELLRTV
jgi:3-deoxy-7-phosphoheptulonate synthase